MPQARARHRAGRVDPGWARRQRTQGQNAPRAPNYAAAEDRRSGAASFEVAAGPFPVPSQDTAERSTRGPRGPARRLHPGSAPGTTDRVKQARLALTVHGLPHGVQVGRGRRARAATARHGEEEPPTGGRRPDPELERPPLGRAIPPRGRAHAAQAPPLPPRPRPLAQSADDRPR